MPKRSSKRKAKRTPRDLNRLASHIIALGTLPSDLQKNPAAVALGRLGGKKGGKIRAEKLTPEERSAIARRAAAARWKSKRGESA